jgi:hypothetical protein
MTYLLGFLFGIIVATAGFSWAECCGAFNVPFDTQIEIERQQAFRDSLREPEIPAYRDPYAPCAR